MDPIIAAFKVPVLFPDLLPRAVVNPSVSLTSPCSGM